MPCMYNEHSGGSRCAPPPTYQIFFNFIELQRNFALLKNSWIYHRLLAYLWECAGMCLRICVNQCIIDHTDLLLNYSDIHHVLSRSSKIIKAVLSTNNKGGPSACSTLSLWLGHGQLNYNHRVHEPHSISIFINASVLMGTEWLANYVYVCTMSQAMASRINKRHFH